MKNRTFLNASLIAKISIIFTLAAGIAVSAPLPYVYTASVTANAKHADQNGNKLRDGKFGSANGDSIQYDDDVSFIIALKTAGPVALAKLYIFNMADFIFDTAVLSGGTSKDKLEIIKEIINDKPIQKVTTEPGQEYIIEIGKKNLQFFKLDIKRRAGAKRILIGEVIFEAE